MKRSTLVVFAATLAAGSSAARAQTPAAPQSSSKKTQEPTTVQKGTVVVDPRDSVTLADVQRAADNLAIAVQGIVKKVTESPELKVAALKLAASSVTAAQMIVTQQAATLQATLDALAREVAAVTAKQESKLKTH